MAARDEIEGEEIEDLHEQNDTEGNESHSEKFKVSLMITEEQKSRIFELFEENDWEIEEVPESQDTAPMEVDSGYEPFRIPQDDNSTECVYCFCKPCITDERNRQLWWETENHAARQNNHALRKEKYKSFWTMLFHRGVFLDPRYMAIKEEALKRDPRRRNLLWHRRDILPKCVLEMVRSWFPNPVGVPYMGHMWE
ncbi:hypothetical protein FSP39_019086 [Pinctada imbricata]|uniref:Uncharacterized protein n=1 Tax=Pinctada imbricata TaxID=66713 RepID=A0AA89BRJ1_PINIB|nr:hypothetical protein FSP39_019086 [Pinctada imbricata]